MKPRRFRSRFSASSPFNRGWELSGFLSRFRRVFFCRHRLTVRTTDSHSVNRSSILRGGKEALVIINGKGGNMSVADAVQLVGRRRPRLAIPPHYAMFAEITEDPSRFLDGCAAVGIKSRVLAIVLKEIDYRLRPTIG